MNKKILLLFAVVFGALGAYVPTLLGDMDMFGGWSILGSLVGGLVGIWLGVIVLKRWG